LLGLLFLGVSLHLDREASEYEPLHRVSVETMIDFSYVLAATLLLLAPISSPPLLGGVLLALSLVGLTAVCSELEPRCHEHTSACERFF
jgi:hypothetical protein